MKATREHYVELARLTWEFLEKGYPSHELPARPGPGAAAEKLLYDIAFVRHKMALYDTFAQIGAAFQVAVRAVVAPSEEGGPN